LVKEALKERHHLINITPHLSESIPIIVPMYHSFPSVLFWAPYYWIGMKMYDFFAGSEGLLQSSYFLSKREALEQFPMLNDRGLQCGIVYFDGQHNDARMNIAIALTAAAKGAAISNHTEVVSLIKEQRDGKEVIAGARVRDTISGEEWDVRAKTVVNATGPFSDAIRKLEDETAPELIVPSAGVHVVLPKKYSPDKMGLLVPETSDGRVVFLLPWEGSTIAGTTDSGGGITHMPKPTEEEVKFIVREVSAFLNSPVDPTDVDAAWSGIRPLARDLTATDTQSICRNHIIDVSKGGLVTIAGGKWTTYRQMAEEVVDKVLDLNPSLEQRESVNRECVTEHVKVIGAAGWSLSVPVLLHRRGFPDDVSEHLSHNYGDKAFEVAEIALATPNGRKRIATDYPYLEAEVVYAARHELALTAVDVLARRMRLAFLNTKSAEFALPRVVDLMANELQWDNRRRASEYRSARRFLRTMNMRHTGRWDWSRAAPLYTLSKRMRTLFGRPVIGASHFRQLLDAFQPFKHPEFDMCVEKDKLVDCVHGMIQAVPELKKHEVFITKLLTEHVSRSSTGLTDFETIVFTMVAELDQPLVDEQTTVLDRAHDTASPDEFRAPSVDSYGETSEHAPKDFS